MGGGKGNACWMGGGAGSACWIGGKAGCEGTGGALGGGGTGAWLGGAGGCGGVSTPSTGSAMGCSAWPPSNTMSKLGGGNWSGAWGRGSGQNSTRAATSRCAAMEPSQKAGKLTSLRGGSGGRQRVRGAAGRQLGG